MASIDVFRNDPNVRAVSAGDHVFEEGAANHDEMYVVVEGEIEIVTQGKTVETVAPGGIFGEMALVDRGPRSAAAVAKTDAKVVPVNEKRFVYLVGNTPFFALEVMQTMAGRLRHMNELV